MKINNYIEIVVSSKSNLSAMSKKTRQSVLESLRKCYTKVEISFVDSLQDLESLVAKKPDLVILGRRTIHIAPEGEKTGSTRMWISDYLTANGINFTGSGTRSLRLQLDKSAAKQNVLDAGLHSSAYFISTMEEPTFKHELNFPLFVKPTDRGHSKGVDEQSVVHTHDELKAKILSIHDDCRSDALVEEYLSGKEFSVAVIEDAMQGYMAMPVEILSPADGNGYTFLSAAVKYADSEQVVSVTEGTLKTAVKNLAINVFKSLGARDYGRIDIRLNAAGVPSFIEANLTPGLSSHGYLARCFFMNHQIGYDDMISTIVGLGVNRTTYFSPPELFDARARTADITVPEFVASAVA